MPAPPTADVEVPDWVRALGLPGLVDMHVHFLPDSVLRKVWAYFDNASENYGMPWPVHYRTSEPERVDTLRELGVRRFAPLVYAHKPGMAAWLTDWAFEFASRTPDAVPTATIYPEPNVADYLGEAISAGARCVKMHVQVGGYDPRAEELTKPWGMLAEAGVPVVIHCGHGPLPGKFTGLDVFEEVLRQHPRLVAVLAHAGLPDYATALGMVERYERVYVDTTMVGVDFTEQTWPLPADWAARLAEVGDRVVLGTDFPNIPYDYASQLRAIAGWAAADDRLGPDFLRAVLHDTPARLLGLDEQLSEQS
ncbi:amidohydrolase family protein [Tamaricihabitans halophyticus]|uniref:amidohydrolase family protein n=1 Tax=Tamaricihabitans halophyticus TaxID=1262583 RepID=UPI001FB3AD61|nr:amidohydrolase family protein [Tamaricihabitans halophyticus]